MLLPGQRLTVVPGARSAGSARVALEGGSSGGGGGTKIHTVRRGDSLWRIAMRYQTSIEELCAINGISRHAKIYPGTKLNVPAN